MEETRQEEVFQGEVVQGETVYRRNYVKETAKTGITFGSALAMVISYANWHSVGWAIIHGLLSWVYVIYYILRY